MYCTVRTRNKNDVDLKLYLEVKEHGTGGSDVELVFKCVFDENWKDTVKELYRISEGTHCDCGTKDES